MYCKSPVVVQISAVTALEFRSNSATVTAAAALVANPVFVEMLAIARAHSPAVERPTLDQMNSSNLAFLAGRCYQHLLTLQTLEELAKPVVIPKKIVATFEPTE